MLHRHTLWIDAVAERLKLSPAVTALALGVISYALFLVVDIAAEGGTDPLLVAIYGLVYFVPVALAALAASIYVRNRMALLEAYALSMVEDPKSATDVIAPISNIGGIAVLAGAIFVVFVVPYLIEPNVSDRAILFVETIPWLTVVWFVATALWTLGYSLVGVYRIGKLPMKLRPFALDRSLGLKPFASTSLRLTAVYYGLVSFTLIADLDAPLSLEVVVARTLGFVVLGLFLFLMPLSSLHRKLVEAKAEKMRWINDRYDRIVRKIESRADGSIDAETQGELLGIDKIQRDIHAIRTWPFDGSALAKLVTILLSVTAILLSRILGAFLRI